MVRLASGRWRFFAGGALALLTSTVVVGMVGALPASAAPHGSASPSNVNFGGVPVGSTSPVQTVTFTNTGASNLTFSGAGVSITGDPSEFGAANSTCTGTLFPGSNCSVDTTLTPTSAGAKSASLNFTFLNGAGGNSPLVVGLAGKGLPSPNIAFNPNSLTFANQQVGTTSPAQGIVVTNTGSTALTISSVSTTGPFSIATSDCTPAPKAAGAQCTVTVTFTPTATGAATGTVVFNDNAPGGGTQTVNLSGTGIPANSPGFSANPSAVTFPNTQVSTTSANKTVTVTNTGGATLHVSSVTLATGNFTDFAIVTNGCTGPILAGANCAVTVNFTPLGTGARSTNLHFVDDAASSPQDVSLSGTGIPAPAPAISFNPPAVTFNPQGVGTTSAATNITVTNTGTAPLNISTITTQTGNAGDFAVSSNTCTAPVAPGANCVVGVVFSPTAVGSRTTQLRFVDDAPGSPQVVNLTGTGTAGPGISFTPPSVTFTPPQPVGTTSAPVTVTATNTGNAPLHITAIAITGLNNGDFSLGANTCTGGPIAVGSNCSVSVTFTPTATGTRSANLVFTDDAPSNPPVPLSGTGSTTGPVINLSPNPVTFADQGVGTTSPSQFVTVSNTGNANLVVSGVSTTGGNAGDFPVNGTGTCVFPISLAPGSSCTVGVAFSPSAAGARTTTLSFSDNAPASPQGVTLNGNGVTGAAISIAPPSVAFGNQAVGTTSAHHNITVTNSGGAGSTLTINNVTLGGANPGDYALSSDTCVGASLTSGATCIIGVTFSPTAVGSRTANVIISDSLGSSPHIVPLGGNGIPGPVVTLSPSPANLHFGNQLVGSTSAPQTVTVTNTGTGNLIITGINNSNNTMFSVTGCTPLPFTVVPGGSCTLSVTFHPTTAGFKTTTITLTDNASPGTQTITADGTGVTTPPGPTTITFDTQDLSFGSVPHGTTSAPQSVTITNTGSSPFQLTSAVSDDTTNFTITGDTCLPGPIAVGATCTITVTFNPTTVGSFSAHITLTDNAVDSPQTILLSGKGT